VNRPVWVPPEVVGVRTVPAGRWFDAVVVPRDVGRLALDDLDARSGAVVEDQARDTHTWLVPPQGAARWRPLRGVTVLGAGHVVAVPPASWTRGRPVRWLRTPAGRYLTRPVWLFDALARALCWGAERYLSAECHGGGHDGCRNGEAPLNRPDLGVVHAPCACPCHAEARAALRRAEAEAEDVTW
jgi:hypothetical protein